MPPSASPDDHRHANPKPKRELLRVPHRSSNSLVRACHVGEWGVDARFVDDDGHANLSHRFQTRALAVELRKSGER
jgi:hypothetical protein